MKKLKLTIALLLFVFLGHAQGTYIEFGATVLGFNGLPVANHPVTVIDSTNSVLNPGIINTYYTDANGNFLDSIYTGVAGALYMFTTDSCQMYLFDTLYTGNTTSLTWNRTFYLQCTSGSSGTNCNYTVSATTTATGQSVLFSSTHQNNPLNPSTYTWSFGDGTFGTGPNPIHTYAAPGTYQYCLQVDSCPVVCNIVVVTAGTACDASFTHQSFGLTTEIYPVSVGTPGHFIFYWGDGHSDTVNSLALPTVAYNHTYSQAGTYAICVEHFDAWVNATCSDIVCDSTSNNSNPLICNASYIVDTVNSQQGSVVVWNATSVTGNTATTYVTFHWDFGDGNTSNTQFPVHTYANPGVYQVCLTVTAADPILGSCTSTFCDSLGVDANGNLIYKGALLGWTLNVYDINSIGIEENGLDELAVYPNPASDELTISLPKSISGETTITLYNVSGSMVKSIAVNHSDISQTLSIADLPNGMYILHVLANGHNKQIKIIKQN